jgi:hypothetical protein
MSDAENLPVEDDADPTPEEIEVVAHADDELPCGGFVCGVYSED